MASESDFSWRKILSFFGAALLVFIGIATISSGIKLITIHMGFNGVMTILGGLASIAWAVYLYKSYNKYSAENNNPKPNYKR